MRKLLNQLLFFSAIGGLMFMASCGSDDSEDPVPGPEIFVELTSGQTITDDVVSAESGAELEFDVDISAPAGFNTLRVSGQTGTILEVNRNDLGLDAGVTVVPTIPVTITLPDVTSTTNITLTFLAVDDANGEGVETVEVEVLALPVEEYTAVLLGGQLNSTTGSFYDVQTNTVHTIGTANDNDDNVDLVFYFVNSTDLQYMIASPDNSNVQSTFEADPDGSGPLNAPGWPLTVENTTRFKPLDGSFDYNSVLTSSDLENSYPEVGTEQERMLDLQVGQVFAFQLSPDRGDRYGIIEVASIDGTQGSNRSITLNVKVQPEDN